MSCSAPLPQSPLLKARLAGGGGGRWAVQGQRLILNVRREASRSLRLSRLTVAARLFVGGRVTLADITTKPSRCLTNASQLHHHLHLHLLSSLPPFSFYTARTAKFSPPPQSSNHSHPHHHHRYHHHRASQQPWQPPTAACSRHPLGTTTRWKKAPPRR